MRQNDETQVSLFHIVNIFSAFNVTTSHCLRFPITAQMAFTQIGNLLQERRKRDLYEMVQYYTSNNNDPAREDPSLKSKLEDNHRHFGNRMDEVIDK